MVAPFTHAVGCAVSTTGLGRGSESGSKAGMIDGTRRARNTLTPPDARLDAVPWWRQKGADRSC